MERNRDVDVRDGGYVRGGVGGCSTFTNDGVDGSSLFIPNLFTPNPVPQYSWFHQTIPNTPSSVLLPLCAIHNSLLNRLTFSTWISAFCLILLILLLSACFFFILNLSAMSSGSRSWMSYMLKPQVCTRSLRWRIRWYARVYQSRDKTVILFRPDLTQVLGVNSLLLWLGV